MGMLKEFREFTMKGNIIDLAVAVIIGAAFGKIVTALSTSLLMPLISLIIGKDGVSEMTFFVGSTEFPVGIFFQAIIDFILIAFVVFLVIRTMNRVKRKKEEEIILPGPPEISTTDKLLMEIRDALRR